MSTPNDKIGDKYYNKIPEENTPNFLLPIRKIFNDDILFENFRLLYKENHLNGKLSILSNHKPGLDRKSSDLIENDPRITNMDSTFLVISKNKPLIRMVDGVAFKVDEDIDNRYFTSFSRKQENGFFVEVLNGNNRGSNNYLDSRNEPMYIHVAHQIINGEVKVIPRKPDNDFEDIIDKGGYYAPVFEDSICDGIVTVSTSNLKSSKLQDVINKGIYPAFSIITAPDFFPNVDLLDIINYDVAPGASNESNFFEGGVASLASLRVRPNPQLIDPIKNMPAFPMSHDPDKLSNTFTAVISSKRETMRDWNQDYLASSFLPDSCSSIFAPGWDITYANKDATGNTPEIFLSTQGLGSPLVEDMKFCAAMNGMWAVACPDSARVFQGSVTGDEFDLKGWRRNPTAIPLMDDELGFHEKSSRPTV
jgi:hypothetical protein